MNSRIYLSWFASLMLMGSLPVASLSLGSVSPVMAQTQSERKATAERLFQQGMQQYKTSQFQSALQSWQQALGIYQEVGDRIWESITLNGIGEVYRSVGQFPQALKNFQQALKIHQEVGNRLGEGSTLNNIGLVYQSLGQFPQALDTFQQALKIHQEVGNRRMEGITLSNIGSVYQSLGQFPQALDTFQQALKIQQEVGKRLGEGSTLSSIGSVYQSLGQFPQALENFQQALKIQQEVGNRLGKGSTLNSIGSVYQSLGQFPQALENLQQALKIQQEVGNRLGKGNTLNNIGQVYRSVGQFPQALENFQQALKIAQEIGNRSGEGAIVHNIGAIYQSLGQYPQALKNFQQALKIAQEVGNRSGEGSTLNSIGVIYNSLGRFSQALDTFQQALKIRQEVGDRSGEGTTLSSMSFAFFNMNQFVKAEKSLLASIAVFTALRDTKLSDASRIALFETHRLTYSALQKVLIAQNTPDKTLEALEISEKGRARSLVEVLFSRYLTRNGNDPSTQSDLAMIRHVAQQQKATLVQYSVITLNVGEPALYIWLIKPTGEIIYKSVNLRSLNRPLADFVKNSREVIGARSRPNGTIVPTLSQEEQQRRQAEQKRNLQQLYQLLIQPIEAELPKNPDDRLVFIPQGDLFLIPFPALMDAKGSYLIEKHTLQISPSIQVLGLTQQLKSTLRPAKGALVVGNPVMPNVWNPETGQEKQLPDLQGSQQEAMAIAQQLQTQPLLWDKATKAAVIQQMQSARLIHLATHGLLEYGNPKESGVLDVPGAIALAPAGQDNGLLTSAEIATLKLNAELVVLSACDTGRGTLTSDGVIGLSRAFITAGVPSVMVSLWAVDDKATADLMQEFYRLWQNPNQRLNKAQALRQAMLMTMKQHRNEPRLWAAFTLIGAAE